MILRISFRFSFLLAIDSISLDQELFDFYCYFVVLSELAVKSNGLILGLLLVLEMFLF